MLTSNFFRKGFTLIEAAVVVGISLVLTTFLIVYTRSSKEQVIFFKEQAVLANAFLRAKTFAIETFQPSQQAGSGLSGEKICGWGVYLNTALNSANQSSYVLFRDVTSGPDCSFPNADQAYTAGSSEGFETIFADPAVRVSCLAYVASAGDACENGTQYTNDPNGMNILFVPPDPIVIFSPAMGVGDAEAVIRLELRDGSRSSEFRISKAGQISYAQ